MHPLFLTPFISFVDLLAVKYSSKLALSRCLIPAAFSFYLALSSTSCSNSTDSISPTLFAGHAIGEGSQGWAVRENQNDPLSKCQQIVSSPVLEQSLESAKNCRTFVDRGTYQIDIKNPNGKDERFFQFRNWRLSTIILWFREDNRANVIADYNTRFSQKVSAQLWRTKEGDYVLIRPVQDLPLLTGVSRPDGFVVVISSASPDDSELIPPRAQLAKTIAAFVIGVLALCQAPKG